jgi:hypothetical protein
MTMSVVTDEMLAGLPDEARLWTFGVGRSLTPEEEKEFLAEVDAFLAGWAAHGQPLAARRAWVLGRFLLVGVDERVTPPSGCSIDALVRILQRFEGEFDTGIVGGGAVWYRPGPEAPPQACTRSEFRSLSESGEVDGDTQVFDLSLTRVGELRAGKWERPAGKGWHGRLLD